MKGEIPRSFRRESRFVLWVALLLVLFLNFTTLLFFRSAVAWAEGEAQRRAQEILRRVTLAREPAALLQAMRRGALEPGVVYFAAYDARGGRIETFSQEVEAPRVLPTSLPDPGTFLYQWRRKPPMLLATFSTGSGFFSLGLDPGAGTSLRLYARVLTILVPATGVALLVLAGLYLRSVLAPYERLLKAAGGAPGRQQSGEPGDEREFLISSFEATITALREKERELESLALLQKERADDLDTAARTLARNLPAGLLTLDRDGLVLELNESGREILKLPRVVRGEPYERALAGFSGLRAILRGVLEERFAAVRREIRWHRGSEEAVIGVTATPAQGADGRFLGVMALFSDLTEVRRLEARVALARHLAGLGQVSAGAAHEFRNAAAAIDGFADLALRAPDRQRAGEHLKAIRREAQEMSRVTGDFLLFAKPESFVPEPVNLVQVAEWAISETGTAFPDLSVERLGQFPTVPGSAVLLRRALANLLRNAAEATPPERQAEKGAVTLEGERLEEQVALAVLDRGEGIPPEDREKIFLPFYSTKPKGSGFGLALVARIAELHGGSVEVEDRPGGGSVFTLLLPAGLPSGDSPQGRRSTV